MRTIIALLFCACVSVGQTVTFHECATSDYRGGESQSVRTLHVGSADTMHAIIVYCVNLGENDLLPNYFPQLPGLIEDYYRRSSFGHYNVKIDAVLSRDANHAFVGRIPADGSAYLCGNDFMQDIFDQADDLYNYGQFDNDGPDHVPNSGDDDGYVDMVFFWYLNYSSRGLYPLGDMNSNYVSNDTSWGPGHVPTGFVEVDIWHGCENRKDLRDVALGVEDWLGPTLHEGGHALGSFPDMDHIGFTNYDHYALGGFDPMSNGGTLYPCINYPTISIVLFGFGGWPSQYNPWFCCERNWTAYTDIPADTPNLLLSDYSNTGQVI